jgi:hypothetical protein
MSFTDGSNSPVVQGPLLPRGEFFHAALTWDGATMTLYFNGNPVQAVTLGPKTIAYDQDPLLLGVDDEGTNNFNWYLRGTLDEVEIFDRALDPAEILAIYNAREYGKCKPQQ